MRQRVDHRRQLPLEAKSSPSEGDSSDDTKSASSDDGADRAPTETSGTCDDRSCVSTSDCCKGYQCSFDPERSKVIRYCMAQ